MGKRGEPRTPVQLPVRTFGTDLRGRIFSERVSTLDVSRSGAKLSGVKATIKGDEIVGLTCGEKKAHFRVKWIGQPGTATEGQVGLLNLSPERPLWDLNLPLGLTDGFRPVHRGERRKTPRFNCDVPVQLRPCGEANMWGKASDISLGGCFVEMTIPLKLDAKFEISLWLGERKITLQGEVASAAPGFGIGVRFVNVTQQDQESLGKLINEITHSLI